MRSSVPGWALGLFLVMVPLVFGSSEILVIHNKPSDKLILKTVKRVFSDSVLRFVEEEPGYYHCSTTSNSIQAAKNVKFMVYVAEGELGRCAFKTVPHVQILTYRGEIVVHYQDGHSTDRVYLSEGTAGALVELAKNKLDKNSSSSLHFFSFNSMLLLVIGAITAYIYVKKFEKRVMLRYFPSEKYGNREEELLPITTNHFRLYMDKLSDFIVEYVRYPHKYVVNSCANPGFVYNTLPSEAPEKPDTFDHVMSDVKNLIVPGLLHWQHPRYHGFFPSGFSFADVLGEALISTLSVLNFSYESSPSFTELEITVINWMGKALGLPQCFLYDLDDVEGSKGGGCIQNSASDAIYASVLTSRRLTIVRHLAKKYGRDFNNIPKEEKNEETFRIMSRLVCYYSDQAHSSIEKACTLAAVRPRAVKTNPNTFTLSGSALQRAMDEDAAKGLIPFHVHLTVGTTNLGTCEPVEECAKVAKKYRAWVHIDAAYGGPTMLLPEYRQLFDGIERVDSIEVNMTKILLMSVSATLFYTKRKRDVTRTFTIEPEYLKRSGQKKGVQDFRHWSINLSRRAFVVPIWFTIRMFGLENMRKYIRRLISHRKYFQALIQDDPRFVIVGIPSITVFGFRLKTHDRERGDKLTRALCEYINRSGKLYFTFAAPQGVSIIRFTPAYQLSKEDDIHESYRILSNLTDEFLNLKPDTITDFKHTNVLISTPVKGSRNYMMNMSATDLRSLNTPSRQNSFSKVSEINTAQPIVL